MSDQIPLHELNKHLFAAMLPATHGEAPAEAPADAPRKGRKTAAAAEQATEGAATTEQAQG